MKNTRFFLTLLLSLPALLPGQTLRDVTVSSNGTLTSPANFWTANAQGIVAGIGTAEPEVSAWKITPYGGTQTITTGETGIGWDENGRFTMQTPAGAIQTYTTGSPSTPVIYWPGRLVINELVSYSATTVLQAGQLTGVIPGSVITSSYGPPFDVWQTGGGVLTNKGITTQTDTHSGSGEELEYVDGQYYPQINVTDMATKTSVVNARYRTAAQMRSDLSVPQLVSVPASATATGTAGQIAYDANFLYICVAENTWLRASLSTW
jgi:hypothetical protein